MKKALGRQRLQTRQRKRAKAQPPWQERAVDIEAILTKLEAFLHIGNFRGALEFLPDNFIAMAERAAVPEIIRIRAVAIAAELSSYRGNDAEAKSLASRFSTEHILQRTDLSARAKHALVVEPNYADRDFVKAERDAQRILAGCQANRDLLGTAVAAYALARCRMRLHQDVGGVYQSCRLATSLYLKTGGAHQVLFDGKRYDTFLRWRIGLLNLLQGYTQWAAGDADGGMRLLLLARWCLEGTGDFIGVANAKQSIGTILRSTSDATGAIELLKSACAAYTTAKHDLNLSRCLTNLGRAQRDLGDLEAARTSLEQALAAAQAAKNERQRAETLVWLAWLYYDASKQQLSWATLARAQSFAKDAVDVDIRSNTHIASEARIILGQCQRESGNVDEAEQLFLGALTAIGDRFPKVKIHAQLSLADLYCSPRKKDLAAAMKYHSEASQGLASASTPYLVRRADEVLAGIRQFKADIWSLTTERLFQSGLKAVEDDLKAWALERVSNREGSSRQRARWLKLSPTGYDKMLKKLSNTSGE